MNGPNHKKRNSIPQLNSPISSTTITKDYFNFISEKGHQILCPFITYEVLEKIIEESKDISRVVTRWRFSDFLEGFADLRIYSLCKDNNIDFYINPRIHLKATIRNQKYIFLSSANLTKAGLAVGEDNANYELSSIIEVKDFKDLVYFEQIVQNSIYVNDRVYAEIEEVVEELEDNLVSEPKSFDFMIDKDYYISQLPQTHDPISLYKFYNNSASDYTKEEHDCAVHDLSIYQVPDNLDKDQFLSALSESFFNHPFIDGLIEEVKKDGFIFFGRVKEWIQNNCVDVPVPKRRELTEITQILYKWIEVLGADNFVVDRPSHSQRIKILNGDES